MNTGTALAYYLPVIPQPARLQPVFSPDALQNVESTRAAARQFAIEVAPAESLGTNLLA